MTPRGWLLLSVCCAAAFVGLVILSTGQTEVTAAKPGSSVSSPSRATASSNPQLQVVVVQHDSLPESLGGIGTGLATLLAVYLAAFGPRRPRYPVLQVTYKPTSPDATRIMVKERVNNAPTGNQWWAFFCRLRVTNTGKDEATDVEGQLLRLWKWDQSGTTLTPDESFFPISLSWAHAPQTPFAPTSHVVRPKLLPGIYRHLDLLKVEDGKGAGPDRNQQGHRRDLLVFTTEVEPFEVASNVWPTKKPHGHYLLEIAVAAGNAKTTYKNVDIDFTGWSNDPKVMFNKHLVVKVLEADEPPELAQAKQTFAAQL